MKFSKNLSAAFRKELVNAVRLSVFLTTLVFGFLFFQNRTAHQEEVTTLTASTHPSNKIKCSVNAEGKRIPASDHSGEARSPSNCE